MKKSTSLIFQYFVLFLIFCSSTTYAQQIKYPKDIEEKIKQVEQSLCSSVKIEGMSNWTLEERMKFYQVNGVSVALVHNYKIEWARGYGWADTIEKRRVTIETLFQAASISKSVNGVGVLKLAQQGKINLDADINQYLKSWKFPYDTTAHGKVITTKNLLSHTAGLTGHGFPGYAKSDTIPTVIQVLNGEKPANTDAIRSAFEPNLKFQYSGGGTTISQLLVQNITRKKYDDYMWKNVLKPLGMTNSTYPQPPLKKDPKQLATGYYPNKEVEGKYHVYPEQAAAGLWTTPTDLSKYIIETQLALQGKSKKVLSKEMTALRVKPYLPNNESALGVFIIEKGAQKYFSHGGWNEGFVCKYIGSLENGNGAVVMTNGQKPALMDEIINSVAVVYDWKGYYTPKTKKVIELSDDILAKYVGKYKLGGNTYPILKEGNKLYLQISEADKWQLFFTSNTEFFMIQNESDQVFTFDEEGKVIGFSIMEGKEVTKAEKIE